MSVSTIFFTCLAIFVLAFGALIVHLVLISEKLFNSSMLMDTQSDIDCANRWFAIYLVCSSFIAIAGLGAAISGIIWLVQALKGSS
jgi:hypothetical protein